MKNGLFKSVLTLLTGSASSQVILLITYFLLARWYGPDAIGQVRNYTAIMFMGAILVMGGYDLALMLNNTERAVAIHLKLCFNVLLFSAALIIPVGILMSPFLSGWLNAPAFVFWGKILPLSILAEGAMVLLSHFLSKKERYKQLSFSLFVYGAAFAIVSLFAGNEELNVNQIFMAIVVSQAVKLVALIYFFSKNRYKLESPISKTELKAHAKQFQQYPTFHLGSSLTNYASREMVVPLLSSFYGTAVAGLFSMANQILQLPMRFILQVVPQVYYQRVAQAAQNGKNMVRKETLSAIGVLVVMAAIPTFLLALFGPWLFTELLGEKWAESGQIVKWLAPFAILAVVVSPLSGLVNIHGKLKQFFAVNILFLVSRLGAIVLGYYIGNELTSISFYGIAAAIGSLGLLFWFLRLSGIIKSPVENG